MISWCVDDLSTNSTSSTNDRDDVFIPAHPTNIYFFGECFHKPIVKQRYEKEWRDAMECGGVFRHEYPEKKGCLPSDQFSVHGTMERLRITPHVYRNKDIERVIDRSNRVFNTWTPCSTTHGN